MFIQLTSFSESKSSPHYVKLKESIESFQSSKENTFNNHVIFPPQYIPQLARGNPDKWGLSVCTVDGQRFSLGDSRDLFSIQSTSKPFTYGLCISELGCQTVQAGG